MACDWVNKDDCLLIKPLPTFVARWIQIRKFSNQSIHGHPSSTTSNCIKSIHLWTSKSSFRTFSNQSIREHQLNRGERPNTKSITATLLDSLAFKSCVYLKISADVAFEVYSLVWSVVRMQPQEGATRSCTLEVNDAWNPAEQLPRSQLQS